jgi:uncharacterized membrane protein
MTNTDSPLLKQRITSIDTLRGAVMLIMAIDHIRDYMYYSGPMANPTNMATTTPILFFTRWITHFCAPTFVFLSGTSAYLAGMRRTKGELSGFLIKRGFWLILVELVLITLALTLDPFYNVLVLQVLWAIGFSMIILGLLVRLPLKWIAVIGVLIFFGHDILDYVKPPNSIIEGDLLKLFLTAFGSLFTINSSHFIFDLYAVIPWTGIMLIGYVFGSLYRPEYDPQKRRKILLYTGLAILANFVILRLINKYGDPTPWEVQRNTVHTIISFFNVSKYPPSLLYSCMTVGTALVILSLTEKPLNKFTSFLIVYGNVPFFYYVLHFYLIRLINVILFFACGYNTSQIVTPNQTFLFKPLDFGFPLWTVYLIWLVVIATLYYPCKWFSNYKRTHHQWWLSYL